MPYTHLMVTYPLCMYVCVRVRACVSDNWISGVTYDSPAGEFG